jgi:ABC-type lipoprotein release transport system permease subunit
VIFLVVYAVAILATLAPAVRASRIRPAEALRYQ